MHDAILYSIAFTILIITTIFEMSELIIDATKDKLSVRTIVVAAASGAALASLILIYVNKRKEEKDEESADKGEMLRLRNDVDILKVEVDDLREMVRRGRTISFNRASGEFGSRSCLKVRATSQMSLASEEYYTDAGGDAWSDRAFSPSPPPTVSFANGTVLPQSSIPNLNEQVFAKMDRLFEEQTGAAEQYEEMKKLHDSEPENVEVLWRLARACHMLAGGIDKKDGRKKELIMEGRTYGQYAVTLSPDHFESIKWAAVLTGTATDFLATKERIEQGNVFKDYLDRALSMDPNDFSVLHMRGRFRFSVANLSWMEKKIASTFFADPPSATIDEAIEDFLAADRVKPGWAENLLWLGKSYLSKKDKSEAGKFLGQCSTISGRDDGEKCIVKEARDLVAKCQ